MTEGAKYLLLGIVLTLAVFAILMPMYRGRGFHPRYYMPYYAHGGQAYKPGVLY